MLWTIGILLLLAILSGDSPFMVKDMDKYVKTHVVDDTKKDKAIDILNEAKKVRKKTAKANADYFKEFSKYEKSRDAKKEDFEKIGSKMLESQKKSQSANIKAIKNIQEYITEDEWKAIQGDIEKGFEKSSKKRNKSLAKLEKEFTKWKDKINKSIADKEKRELAIAAAERLKTTFINNKKIVQEELLNHNSVIHKYKASEAELKKVQDEYLKLAQEVFDVAIATHFEIIELTTPDEWKKIN